jgi:hypothetical protein
MSGMGGGRATNLGTDPTSAATATSGSSGTGGGGAYEINVTPVQFFDESIGGGTNESRRRPDRPLGAVSVSFWRVDDTYGPPSMGDLMANDDDADAGASRLSGRKSERYTSRTNQLTLTLRADRDAGIVASLSGFSSAGAPSDGDADPDSTEAQEMAEANRVAIQGIQQATCNPLALSMSDALLAATRWCADRKCRAVVQALRSVLPTWIVLAVDRGSIAVAAAVAYHGGNAASRTTDSGVGDAPILFRLTCDARTGSFVACFSRQCQLLRELAGNCLAASESMSLRIASLPRNRRRAASASSSGRAVRDAFQGLIRSMNLLGQRVGVGGAWDDADGQQARLLRERSIRVACADAKVSLAKACGMAALYGMSAVAIGAALGMEAVPDMYVSC